MSKQKQQSAFPQLTWEMPQGATTAFHFTRGGLTKRELFAGMAMQGWLASFAGLNSHLPTPESMASRSVAYADALIAELGKAVK